MSRADSTAWTSTVEHVHTTGFRWSWSSSATYCVGWGRERSRDTGEATQQGHCLPAGQEGSEAQTELQGPMLCRSDHSRAKVRLLAASEEKVGPDPA